MHPFYSLYATEMHQAELLREAGQVARSRRRSPVRAALGYWLVELGLRLAVQPRPRAHLAHSGPVR